MCILVHFKWIQAETVNESSTRSSRDLKLTEWTHANPVTADDSRRSGCSIPSQTFSGKGQVMLQLDHLPLQQGYGTNATIDRVPKPCFSLVSQGIHRLLSLLFGHFDQDLAHIAGTKNLVDLGEFLRFIGSKIWCENTVGSAPPFQ